MRPSIDHGTLSPSGRVSERARRKATERAASVLFPPGYWESIRPEPSEDERRASEIQRLRRTAAQLRDLASRGMHPRSYPKQATALEARADALERGL